MLPARHKCSACCLAIAEFQYFQPIVGYTHITRVERVASCKFRKSSGAHNSLGTFSLSQKSVSKHTLTPNFLVFLSVWMPTRRSATPFGRLSSEAPSIGYRCSAPTKHPSKNTCQSSASAKSAGKSLYTQLKLPVLTSRTWKSHVVVFFQCSVGKRRFPRRCFHRQLLHGRHFVRGIPGVRPSADGGHRSCRWASASVRYGGHGPS